MSMVNLVDNTIEGNKIELWEPIDATNKQLKKQIKTNQKKQLTHGNFKA
jgi:hypothetical protein